MFREVQFLNDDQIRELRQIAASTPFVDGRISNPNSKIKNNLQLHDPKAYERSAYIVAQAIMGHEDFRNFAFPVAIAPPLLVRYEPGMRYGSHADAAFLNVPPVGMIRSDLSCTVFLNDPASYEGGALQMRLGTQTISFKLPPGHAVVYPSNTLHEVEPVTKGERLVAITFIQSRIKDPYERDLLYELNEVAALEGLSMKHDNFTRLQLVQNGLLRHWADKP